MLDEQEWEEIEPLLRRAMDQTKRYRAQHGVSLAEATQKGYGQAALERYFEITGFRETNPNALWHRRLSDLGPPCSACGKPLRTPQATFCAACGAQAPASSSPGPETV
ncbi:MAG TPA: hypothetical protein EYH07_08715 [Kiloniellaceae bacterium]|nr:hypothetical protein [Kiloniellaceae bacterium]